ncbi:hypothetical protein NEDG_01988 [Nematocida displodere]|uniref:RING-type domain-containing protein n=1 Tax=Nematocida displodere TaxID=1805483 RepID=A0A177EFF4_9MICR|nr:hypothetical protein NEDG_01988 [Nematocida displodere]
MQAPIIIAQLAAIFAFALLGLASRDSSLEDDGRPYLVSPYTDQTIAFFEMSGSTLATRTVETTTYIVKDQYMPIKIYLNSYDLADIPDHLVEEMVFDCITIGCKAAFKYQTPPPLALALLEKVLRAFGTALHADRLTITTLGEILDSETDVSHSQQACEALSGLALSPNPVTEDEKTPPKLLKLYAKHIELQRVSVASICWLLPRLDVSECEVALFVQQVPELTNLRCLDGFNPKALLKLYVGGAYNLADIDCVLLRENKVLNELGLWETPEWLYASPETLQAIATKHWDRMGVPIELWIALGNVLQKTLDVANLIIYCKFLAARDGIWDTVCEEKTSVKSLELRLTNPNSARPSNRELTELLVWIDSWVIDTERLTISVFCDATPPTFTDHIYIDIEPLLPSLKRLYCVLNDGRTICLYNRKSILWIEPAAYKDWADGKLNTTMAKICSQKILSVSDDIITPFTPPTDPNPNPTCFECNMSVEEIVKVSPKTQPIYLGIVCKAGHMACKPCLDNLHKTKYASKEAQPQACPLCGDELCDTGLSSVIRTNPYNSGDFNLRIAKITQCYR